MKRQTFNLIAVCVWISLFVVVNLFWYEILVACESMLPELEQMAGPVILLAAVIVGLSIQGRLANYYAPKQVVLEKDLTAAQKRERAIREAALALRHGRIGAAMLIYEEAGMFDDALKLAQRLGDKPGMARLFSKVGNYTRARHLYLELKDYEAAAQVSALMGKIDAARDYYKRAAEACQGKVPEAQEAGLWERAGDRAKAAHLYEIALELERAGVCYKLLGDKENATRCAGEAEVMRAFEEKQRGETREVRERRIKHEEARASAQAKELRVQGDFLGAGIMYRKAGQMMEAAMAFERFEEWERAAEAYEKAGLKDRAELVRMHIEVKEEELAAEVPPPPAPAAAMPAVFVPITRAQAVPVYLGVGGAPPSSPQARLEVCRRVRRGNFLEAAEFAKAAGDWVMAAAYYEHAGNHLAAADIYRQIGDINAAAWCLERAGRCREAALMTLAVGQKERAVEILLNAIEKGKDSKENVLALGELLIRWGKCPQAVQLLHKRIPPGAIDEANAEIYYQFARRLEDQKAWREAHSLYDEIVSAGAESDDITERKARIAALLAEPLGSELEAEQKPEFRKADKIDSMLVEALERIPELPREEKRPLPEEGGKTRVFQFAPGRQLLTDLAAGAGPGVVKTLFLPAQELSLFGRPVGDPKPDYSLDSTEDFLAKIAELGRDAADPFKPGQRYQLKAELGRGGMGVVYETLDTVLGRRVALKLILKEVASPESYQHFLVEARAIALLSHPNVVTIYDIGLMDLRHYIAMEFVSGGNLGTLIKKEKALPLKEALRLFIEISQALQAAHEAGVVHRDIKPENVLLTDKRQVKLSDFGLAEIKQELGDRREKAMMEISGTPGFMAPEQLGGEEAHPRFDIYALGITLFTMIVGKPPHEIANKTSFLDIAEFQESGEQIPLRRIRLNVPEAIEQVYLYCTKAKPDDRYQSIDAFLPTVEQIYSSSA